MSEHGFIKLPRAIQNWEWYDEPNTAHLYITLMLMANHEDKKWRGETIKRGTLVSSLSSLSTKTGLSVMQVRTCLKNLQKSGDITSKTTNKNTLIIVTNYNLWQDDNKQITHHLTIEQQTNNNQITTNKNDKNVKNVKNERIKDIVEKVIDYLNHSVGKHYKPGSKNCQKYITARLNEGYKLEDFQRVIDIKCKEWLNSEKMTTYLRPETLFGTKFESYLQQALKDEHKQSVEKEAEDYIEF